MTEGKPRQGRNAALFLAHLDDLRSRLRRYHKIHGHSVSVRFPVIVNRH